MTIGELVAEKTYDYVEYRLKVTGAPDDDKYGILVGCFRVQNGRIVSLNGDIYSYNEKVFLYKKWKDKKRGIKSGLTVVVQLGKELKNKEEF